MGIELFSAARLDGREQDSEEEEGQAKDESHEEENAEDASGTGSR